ncbi:hypothetical protein D3C85_1164490 [compost metagenome]
MRAALLRPVLGGSIIMGRSFLKEQKRHCGASVVFRARHQPKVWLSPLSSRVRLSSSWLESSTACIFWLLAREYWEIW